MCPWISQSYYIICDFRLVKFGDNTDCLMKGTLVYIVHSIVFKQLPYSWLRIGLFKKKKWIEIGFVASKTDRLYGSETNTANITTWQEYSAKTKDEQQKNLHILYKRTLQRVNRRKNNGYIHFQTSLDTTNSNVFLWRI